jgi:hypothetical protein
MSRLVRSANSLSSHKTSQEAPLLLKIGHFCLAPSVCLVVATHPIADAEENHYYLSPEGDLYLYVVPPEPQYRFLLCPLDRAQDESTNA